MIVQFKKYDYHSPSYYNMRPQIIF